MYGVRLELRILLLEKFMSNLEAKRNEFSELITLENGKTIEESKGEVDAAIPEEIISLVI